MTAVRPPGYTKAFHSKESHMRTVVAVLILALVVGAGHTQQPPPTPPASPGPPLPVVGPRSSPQPSEPTIEQLLAELDQIQVLKANLEKQKAEVERREREVVEAARKKLAAHAERLNKAGVGTTGVPDRVGRVVFVGKAAKEEEVLKAVGGIKPGVEMRHPDLTAIRQRLKDAGYPDAKVEFQPAMEPGVVDIMVTVDRP